MQRWGDIYLSLCVMRQPSCRKECILGWPQGSNPRGEVDVSNVVVIELASFYPFEPVHHMMVEIL